MSQSGNSSPKSPTSHLHAVNLIVALLAGIISITGGIYSIKSNFFSGPEYGSLQGTVRDEKIAKPLKLVSVEVADMTGAIVNTATTDDDGHYSIEALKTGNYVVKFAAPLHKIETKTIKIEKNIWSSVNLDLVPEVQSATFTSVETAVSAPQTIPQSYVPATATYPTTASTASGYHASAEAASSGAVAQPAYATSNVSTNMQQEPSFADSQFSGPRRPPRRGPPRSYGSDSTSGSQGDSFAEVGTQLLSALIAKKSESN